MQTVHLVHRVRDCLVPDTNDCQHVHARLLSCTRSDLQPRPPHASRVPPFVPVVARSSSLPFSLVPHHAVQHLS